MYTCSMACNCGICSECNWAAHHFLDDQYIEEVDEKIESTDEEEK